MKNLLKITAFVLSLGFYMIPLSANASINCSATSTANLHQGAAAANGNSDYCIQTPETLKLKFHEFGLCTAIPTPGDKTACTEIFTNQTGIELELTLGNIGSLIEDMTIEEGLYTHAYLIISKDIEISVEMQFESPRTDDSGNNGVHCFTDGRSINSSASIISCAQSPNVQKSPERLSPPSGCGAPSWGSYGNSFPGYSYIADGVTVTTDLYLINNSGALSSGCATDFAFFAAQRLVNDIDITPETEGLNIAISLTGSVSVGFMDPNISAPTDAMFNGLQFYVSEP